MTFRAVLALSLLSAAAAAQAPTATQTMLPPPIPAFSAQYRYWPEQFVEWTSSDFPYAQVELDVDAHHGSPLYELTLTTKDGQREHYVNDPSLVAEAQAAGDTASLAKFAFDRPDTLGKGATYTLRAALPNGTPIQWRFVQGSEMIESGGGLTPLPTIPVPVFAYREQAAVAGEGSAIAIGKQVSSAEVWTEISHPPYFVAYRGGYSSDAHLVVFRAGKTTWKIDSAPPSLANGAQWKLSDGQGRTRTLTVTKLDGLQATLRDEDSSFPRIRETVVATQTDKGWKINSIHFVPNDDEKHAVTIQCTDAALDLYIAKKKIASATLEQSGSAATVTFKSPDWIKGKGTQGQVLTEDGNLTIAIRPTK